MDIRTRLAASHPEQLQKAEDFLEKHPDGEHDPNNRRPQRWAMDLALAAIEADAVPPVFLDPLLARAFSYPPETNDSVSGHKRLLKDLPRILRAMPMPRREALLMPHPHVLAWSLARISQTLTPAIAERAAWKLADPGHRLNSGGTWTAPFVRPYQAALFAALKATAVPAIVAALPTTRKKKYLIEVLGRTDCPEAAAPLVAAAAGGVSIRDLARAGLDRLMRQGHSAAVLSAISAQLSARRKAARVAAAELLLITGSAGQPVAQQALKTARDAEVRQLLAGISRPPHPGQQRWEAIRDAADIKTKRRVRKKAKSSPYSDRFPELYEEMKSWTVEQRTSAAADSCVAMRAVNGLTKGLLQAGLVEAEPLSFAVMEVVDEFEYDTWVTRALEDLERSSGKPLIPAAVAALHRRPKYRGAIFEYLCARDFFAEDVAVREALALGMADTSKAIAAKCAAALQAAGQPALPQLKGLLSHPKAAVKSAAQSAIAAIEATAAAPANAPITKTAAVHVEVAPLPTLLPRFFPGSKLWLGLYQFRDYPHTVAETLASRWSGPTWQEQLAAASDEIIAFSVSGLKDDSVRAVLSRPGLAALTLSKCRDLTDSALSGLPTVDKLRYLSIDDCGRKGSLTAGALQHIGGCANLQWLGLVAGTSSDSGDPWVTDRSLAHLSGLTSLRGLILRCFQGSLKSLKHLPPLPKLELLSLSGTAMKIDRAAIDALKAQPALHTLVLDAEYGPSSSHYRNTRLSDKGLALLAELPGLRHLDLRHCEKLTGPGFEALASHPGLSRIDLTECYKLHKPEVFEWLGKMPALRILDLEELRVVDATMLQGLAASKTLSALQVDVMAMGEVELEILAGIGSLRHLSLKLDSASTKADPRRGYPQLTPEAFRKLSALPDLQTLCLDRWIPLTRTHIEQIVQLPLRHLILDPDRQLSVDALMLLGQMKTLRFLSLGSDPMEVTDALRTALPDCTVDTLYGVREGLPDNNGIPLSLL